MSKSRTEDQFIKCPYWRGFCNDKVTRCEGFVCGSEVRIVFKDKAGRRSYKRAFCNTSFYRCPIYRANQEEKYGDDD